MQISLRTKKIYLDNDCPHEHMFINDKGDIAKDIQAGKDFEISSKAIKIKDKKPK